MQINPKNTEEHMSQLTLPKLKSQSVGNLDRRQPKNSIGTLLKRSQKKK